VTGEIRPEYEHRPAPPGGPARGISGVAFADRSLGVGIADGQAAAVGVGQLQVTTDGGRTWRTAIRADHLSFEGHSFIGRRHIVVLGGAPPPKQPWNLDPLVVRSDDRGKTWRRFAPRLPRRTGWPLSPRFVTPTLGFALAPPGDVYNRHWLLRTTDGGRSWQSVRKPADAGYAVSSVDFVDHRTGYATSPRRCGAGLYRTDDGGATWRAVPGSCIHGVQAYSVDFVDPRHGFLAGGSLKRRVVLATSDGGRTWATRSTVPSQLESWIRVEFDSGSRVGWGLRSECDPFHPPCAPVSGFWRTVDGGSTWERQRPPLVDDFDAIDSTHVWAVGSGTTASGVLWKTTNGGRAWTRIAGSRGVAPESVSFAGPSVVVETLAGYLGSDDSGRTWRWLDLHFPHGSAPELASVRPDLSFVPSSDGRWVWLSANLGRTWRRVRLPAGGAGAETVRFADARGGVAAVSGKEGYTTSDGGRTWVRRQFPFSTLGEVQLAAAPGLITEADGYDSRRVALSCDGGKSWRFVELPRGYLNVGAWPGRQGALVLGADRMNHGTETYLSFDSGKTWQRVRGTLPSAVAQEGKEAWGVEEGEGRHLLWHSTDGGRHWTEVWPRPPATG
jgi:photosystem II stability/assembly factor-like uncharacterized protein